MWRDCARAAACRMNELRPGAAGLLRACLVAGLLMVAGGLCLSCGGGPAGPGAVQRRAEFVVASVPAGLEGTVQADSMAWAPGLFRVIEGGALEVEGTFLIVFSSRAPRPLELFYDLRFLDADGIFVDQFIPFGLPLRLPAGGTVTGQGAFTIRSAVLAYPDLLAILQVVVRAAEVEE